MSPSIQPDSTPDIAPNASSRVRVGVILAGAAAAVLLGGVKRYLTLTAVFQRSFYAEDENGALVCFIKPGLEPGPLNLTCAPWPDAISAIWAPGQHIWRLNTADSGSCAANNLNNQFLIPPNFLLDASEMPLWQPPDWPRANRDAMGKGLDAINSLLPRFAKPESLARLLIGSSPPAANVDACGNLQKAFFTEAEKGLRLLANALTSSVDAADITTNAESGVCDSVAVLLGLGGGLTPAGDDALGGALLALHALRLDHSASSLAREIGRRVATATNRISAAHLAEAARGWGAEAMHLCLASIMRGGEGLAPLLTRLDAIGHTSGWDALTGAIVIFRRWLEAAP